MSQTTPNYENRVGTRYMPYGKRTLRKDKNRGSQHYNRSYKNFHYTNYNFQPPWGHWRNMAPLHRFHNVPEKQSARPPSPFSGTEEYTLKKIQETSDMIKKRLMMPETEDCINKPETLPVTDSVQNKIEESNFKNDSWKTSGKTNKKVTQYNVGEIHDKIMNHITKLSYGRKMNLISGASSGYDVAIQQIYQQKRLELSKVLRDMCSNQTVENSEVINSIIPDIGIKLEDLPLEVIEELSSTLGLNFDDVSFLRNSGGTVSDKCDVITPTSVISETFRNDIKEEMIDISDTEFIDMASNSKVKREGVNFLLEETSDFGIVPQNDNSIHTAETYVKKELQADDIPKSIADVDHSNTTSVSLQTDFPSLNSVSTQTAVSESDNYQSHLDGGNIRTLDDAITLMLKIDKEIMHLTELRQSIFLELQKRQTETNKNKEKETHNESGPKKTPVPIKEIPGKSVTYDSKISSSSEDKNGFSDIPTQKNDVFYKTALTFKTIAEKILVMKVIEDTLLAASERGNIYYFSTLDGSTVAILHASPAPITSLCYWVTRKNQGHLLVGSSDPILREFDFESRERIRLLNLADGVQCMELAWECLFVGTVTGKLIRYSVKFCKIEFEEKISEDSVMVLKATQEGARRVLLVGLRNEPVCVRDAMSGLYLRSMAELVTPTVYSLVLTNSMVYCGTKFHDLLVFSFHDGNLVHKLEATNSKGISCMKVDGNLLFASCYNGNIYVYNVKSHAFVGTIKGPGGVILSMEILGNVVVVGTMSLNFKSILIPSNILIQNKI